MSREINPNVLIQELLRVGLIASRNLSVSQQLNRESRDRLSEWLNLCHSLPSVLLGESRAEAVRYFVDGDAELFLKNYPRKDDADYLQASSLLDELRVYTHRKKQAPFGTDP